MDRWSTFQPDESTPPRRVISFRGARSEYPRWNSVLLIVAKTQSKWGGYVCERKHDGVAIITLFLPNPWPVITNQEEESVPSKEVPSNSNRGGGNSRTTTPKLAKEKKKGLRPIKCSGRKGSSRLRSFCTTEWIRKMRDDSVAKNGFLNDSRIIC